VLWTSQDPRPNLAHLPAIGRTQSSPESGIGQHRGATAAAPCGTIAIAIAIAIAEHQEICAACNPAARASYRARAAELGVRILAEEAAG
jgi:hypothetical protein